MPDAPRFSDMDRQDPDTVTRDGEVHDPLDALEAPAVTIQGRAFEANSPVAYLMSLIQATPPPNMTPEQWLFHERMRLEAAKSAAPFIHPRLAQVEHSGKVALSHEEALEALS